MTALSIRNMHVTMREVEVSKAQNSAAWYDALPAEQKADRGHYWHIQRKAKKGRGWIYVRDLHATKREAAELFCAQYRNRTDGKYRLRYVMSY